MEVHSVKQFSSKNQKIGEIGEDIACRFLAGKGFSIVERNYTKKCGEIDVIARKGNKIHFVEVKTVSWQTLIRPEDNLHPVKMKRFGRIVEVYLLEKGVSYETPWQADAVLVRLDLENKKAKVEKMENIIL